MEREIIPIGAEVVINGVLCECKERLVGPGMCHLCNYRNHGDHISVLCCSFQRPDKKNVYFPKKEIKK